MKFRDIRRAAATATVLVSMATAGLAQGKGFDLSSMDTSVNACEDFFQYANGSWVKRTEIPKSQVSWGTFNILIDNNDKFLHEVLENAAKSKNPAGSDARLIGDFYSACMDEAAIERACALF